jgi:hypothetical protein
MVYKVTIKKNAQNVLRLNQCVHGHRFKDPGGGCEWSDRHKIRVGEVSHNFQFKLNTLGVLNGPTDKNLKN